MSDGEGNGRVGVNDNMIVLHVDGVEDAGAIGVEKEISCHAVQEMKNGGGDEEVDDDQEHGEAKQKECLP